MNRSVARVKRAYHGPAPLAHSVWRDRLKDLASAMLIVTLTIVATQVAMTILLSTK